MPPQEVFGCLGLVMICTMVQSAKHLKQIQLVGGFDMTESTLPENTSSKTAR